VPAGVPGRYRAAVLRAFRQPFTVEEVEAWNAPEGWVWLRVRATGVCGRDRVVWLGGFPNLKPPLILGHEVFGELDGRPYGVYPAFRAECGGGECLLLLGENVPGGYAEYVAVPRENLVPLPTRDYPAYAAAVCGVATFIHASRVAGVGRGDRVLVTGSLGGVGIHGIQYLVSLGATVYAYTRRREAARVLEELGAVPVHGFDFYRREGRVDVVMELVGAKTINESMRALRFGGTLVLIGNVHGEPVTITRPALLVMREIKVTGSAAYTREEYEEAVEIVGSGRVRPFYKTYRLEDINKAYEDIASGRVVGRAVVTP